MNKLKISIIVPVYNVDYYLEKSINSILGQSFRDFELILVNDGSTDSSLEICQKYQKKDNRIILIDKLNEGIEITRRVGMSYAKGDYITYLDCDDWFCEDALKKMYEAAITTDSEIVVGSFIRVMDSFGFIKKKGFNLIKEDLVIDNKLFMNDYYKNFFGINIFPVTVWAKLYKKSLLDSVDIAIGGCSTCDDLFSNIQVFPEAKKIHFINDSLVYYRFGGLTSKLNEAVIVDAILLYNIKKRMIVKYELFDLTKYIVIEAKNYLATYIRMLIEYKGDDKQFVFDKVKEITNKEEYLEISKLISGEGYLKNDFVNALIDNDVASMIQIQEVLYKKQRIKNKALKIISRILKF